MGQRHRAVGRASAEPAVWIEPADSIEPCAAQALTPEARAVGAACCSLSDLDALRLQVPGEPAQTFFAAGTPWFFTLFGRDSSIAASLALPVDRSMAEGTLRTLARRQGTVVDVETTQQPGKILHEVRAQGMDTWRPAAGLRDDRRHPAVLDRAAPRRAAPGLGDGSSPKLPPALESASLWLLEHADADGDSLLEYLDDSGHGLGESGLEELPGLDPLRRRLRRHRRDRPGRGAGVRLRRATGTPRICWRR